MLKLALAFFLVPLLIGTLLGQFGVGLIVFSLFVMLFGVGYVGFGQ